MDIQQMQQQLISRIGTVNNEDILRMLGEELSYSLQSKDDLSALLTEEDFKELTMLACEPVEQSTMSLNEFNTAMSKWRMK